MGIFHPYPFLFRLFHAFLYLYVDPLCPALHQVAQVHFVGQYPPNGRAAPFGAAAPGEASPVVQPQGLLVLLWGQDMEVIELFRNGRDGHPLNLPREDPADNLCRVIVYQQRVPVLRRFPVAVHGKGCKAFPLPALHSKLALHLGGNVTAIAVVYEIFYRQYDVALPGIRRKAVVPVGEGDESHPQSREYLVQVPAGLDIIAPEPGQVLHDDAVHPPRLDVAYHPFEFWPLEVAAGIVVVRIAVEELHVLLFPDKGTDQLPLAADAVALGFERGSCTSRASGISDSSCIAVLPGKPEVHGRIEIF